MDVQEPGAEAPTCRICRSEAEPGAPLYHPCKCTGSIRYCHQDWYVVPPPTLAACSPISSLIEWLQHSRKKYCELCKYPFVFHKRYAHSMPQGHLPYLLYARYVSWRCMHLLGFAARVVLAVFGWLGVVPFITLYVWRTYFAVCNLVADTVLHLHDGERGPLDLQLELTRRLGEASSSLAWPIIQPELLRNAAHAVRRDWFDALVLTGSVGISFMGVFLLREWVLQNMHHLLEPRDPDADRLLEAVQARAAARAAERAAAIAAVQARADRFQVPGRPELVLGPRPEGPALDARAEPERAEGPAPDARAEPERPPRPAAVEPDAPAVEELRARRLERFGIVADAEEALAQLEKRSPEALEGPADQVAEDEAGIPEDTEPAAGPAPPAAPPADAPENRSDASEWTDEDSEQGDEDDWVDEEDSDAAPAEPVAPPPAPRPAPRQFDEGLDEGDWEENEEELQEQFEDDIEGALEVIGLRGPIAVLGQNLVLVQALCIAVMLVFVALPYLTGRLLGFKAFNVVLLPVQVLRVVTDPVFDFVIAKSAAAVRLLLPASAPARSAAPSPSAPSPSAPLAQAPPAQASPALLGLPHMLGALTAQRHVAPVATWVHRIGHSAYAAWSALQSRTEGKTALERTLCVVLGHVYTMVLLMLEARFGRAVHGQPNRWAQLIVDQHLIILKVVFFMGIDLVLFPLVCGALLDWCLLPLFPGVTLARRVAEASTAPFTFFFFRWTTGTVYMFYVAQTVSAMRSILRPGVICWMRESNDAEFQPIREILSQGSVTQLRRLGDSLVIYLFGLLALVGFNVRVLDALVPGLVPLRWHQLHPLTAVPLELLLVHFGLRRAVRATHAARYARRAFRRWWIAAAKLLRLSAFLLGDHQPEEQGSYTYPSVWARITALFQRAPPPGAEFQRDGSYARVPADDYPVNNSPIFIQTDEHGVPTTPKAREALEKQLAEISQMASKPPYTIVHLPPNFARRIGVLLVLLWASMSVVICLATSIPMLLGRALLAQVATGVQHDPLAFGMGLITIVLTAWLCKSAAPFLSRRSLMRRVRQDGHAFLPWLGAQAKVVYLLVAFTGVVPLLAGLLLHQYILTPLQYSVDQVPRVNVAYAWALGLVSVHSVFLGLLTFLPDHVPILWDVYDSVRTWRPRGTPLTCSCATAHSAAHHCAPQRAACCCPCSAASWWASCCRMCWSGACCPPLGCATLRSPSSRRGCAGQTCSRCSSRAPRPPGTMRR